MTMPVPGLRRGWMVPTALAIAMTASVLLPGAARATALAGPALKVDAAAARRSISPDIYGMNDADAALAAELHLTVDRFGGDTASRYNWKNNTYNTGSDWYFENIPPGYGGSGAAGLIDKDRSIGTRTVLTVPMTGWVAKDSPADHPFACGYNVSKYGPQTSVDTWDPACGNGDFVAPPVTPIDPTDTSIAIDPSLWASDWVKHNVATYGTAANGGVPYYELDNEPSLWNSTHRDVHPAAVSDDELTNRSIPTARAIKAADKTAKVMGPSQWGYLAYLQSAVGD